jgi:hypothetical protein
MVVVVLTLCNVIRNTSILEESAISVFSVEGSTFCEMFAPVFQTILWDNQEDHRLGDHFSFSSVLLTDAVIC